jgi:glycosyltransferase involved in cell wall biosynthesis
MRYYILKSANRGPSSARNIGWRRASGEWIQFLDSDDLLHAQKIEIQAKEACFLPPQVAVVYSDWARLEFKDGEWLANETIAPLVGDDAVVDLLKTENFLHTGSQLFRRAWLDKVSGYDERHWLIEDVDLQLRIALEGGKFHKVRTDYPLFFYRQRNDGSLSRRNPREFIEGCVRNARMVEAYFRSNGQLTPQRAHVLASIYFQGARYFAATDKREFETLVKKIESLIPNFVPSSPLRLRWLSRLIGYRRAERIAVLYRRLKKHLKDQ